MSITILGDVTVSKAQALPLEILTYTLLVLYLST